MREELQKVLKNSYAKYSNFRVSALVETKDGNKFYGVNIENASYGATVCAERVAIFSAVANGYKPKDFKKLVLYTPTEEVVFPCFLCRQVLVEFFPMDAELIIMNDTCEKFYYMEDILPHTFSEEDLK